MHTLLGNNMEGDFAQPTDDPRNEYLRKLWSTQLNIPKVDLHQDYFEAGGSSMQLIEMLLTVSEKFGKDIDYSEFMANPCIHKLNELLGN